MPFLLLILSNLMRQRIRTALTVVGISIGITTVVALGVFVRSAQAATEQMLTAGGSDFAVGRAGSADLTFSTLTSEDLGKLDAYDEIEHVAGVLMAFSRVGSNPFFLQLGIEPADLEFFDVPLTDGQRLTPGVADQVMLGAEAASDLGLGPGDRLELRDTELLVVGTYRTGITMFDNGAVLPLAPVQEYERKEGLVTLAYVTVRPETDVRALADSVERDHPELATLVDLGDIGDVDQGLEIMDAIELGVTGLAVFIGSIAVMNTMVMAVFERTREFGILRALGWRTRRILQMVLGESLLLCLMAAVFGSALAVGVTKLLVLVPTISAFITPEYPLDVFLRGLLVGIGVALLGAIYPAYRAASFSPAQAIRYE
jgi:putative ABC transport system permease protein